MSASPLFIALEGIDGAGTTTQCQRLADWLASLGRRPVTTREPSDGPIGRLIREILRGRHGEVDRSAVALLFAADRLDHLEREIRPALAAGRDVISDRYVLSSLAYQGLDDDLPWVQTLNERAVEPSLTLLLEAPVDVCLERLDSRSPERELYERRETLERVCRAYGELARVLRPSGRLVVIDGSPPADAVEAEIRRAVEAHL